MGRNRKQSTDAWLPPGVRCNGYSYVLRNKTTQGKQVRLCAASASRAQVWAAYESFNAPADDTLGLICSEYLTSPQYCALAPGTQRQYRNNHTSLSKLTCNGGQAFMALHPAKISPGLLQQILDIRLAAGHAVKGNREIKGFLSAVYAWALARDRIPGLQANPCHAVQRNTEHARMHYVQDWELQLAQQHATPWLAHFMQLAYLLYARAQEVLALTRKDCLPEGICVVRLKGSKTNIVKWSPHLKAVVDACKSGPVLSPYLLTTHAGKRITYAMLRKPWAKTMKQCQTINPAFQPFTPHDLKRKGITDQVHEQNSAGHKTEAMRQRYRVKPDQVEPAK